VSAVLAGLERSTLGAARARVLAGVSGRVLEIGAGTGANLGWYPATVDHLDVCEPDPHMRRRLERRLAQGRYPFTVAVHEVAADGPFPAPPYDVVVATLVLCSVPEQATVTAAIRSVLADAGRFCYLEHVHAGGLRGRLQSVLSPHWARRASGCHLDRPATAAVRDAGMVPVEQRWLRRPPPFFLAVEGEAIIRSRPAPDAARPQ